jgi:hypothetical protein
LCRLRASTTTAISARWRERPLPGNFRGDGEWQELAVNRLIAHASQNDLGFNRWKQQIG